MKIIEKRIDLLNDKIPNKSIFLDIETTGFNRAYHRIYLMGTLAKEENGFIFRQFLTEYKGEEKELLVKTIELLNNFETIITFNGDAFDLGFIEKRAKANSLNFNFQNFKSLDIYKEIKDKTFMLNLENQKLKTIEKFLGIDRDDIFTGGELIQLYYEYEAGNKKLESPLLLHNEEDILNMPKLMEIFDIIKDNNRIIVKDNIFDVSKITLGKKSLKIIGDSTIDKAYFNFLSSEFTVKDNFFNLNAFVKEDNYSKDIKCIYIEKSGLDLNCNYNYKSPNEILLLKYDKQILYKNAFDYLKKYLENIL